LDQNHLQRQNISSYHLFPGAGVIHHENTGERKMSADHLRVWYEQGTYFYHFTKATSCKAKQLLRTSFNSAIPGKGCWFIDSSVYGGLTWESCGVTSHSMRHLQLSEHDQHLQLCCCSPLSQQCHRLPGHLY